MKIINLDAADEFHVDRRNVWTRNGTTQTRSRLPSGPHVSLMQLGTGRGHLNIGGFNTVTVQVQGPADVLQNIAAELVPVVPEDS